MYYIVTAPKPVACNNETLAMENSSPEKKSGRSRIFFCLDGIIGANEPLSSLVQSKLETESTRKQKLLMVLSQLGDDVIKRIQHNCAQVQFE